LRIDHHGSLVTVAETTTDDRGRFRFDDISTGDDSVCLPGANYKGIHYPGMRVRLDNPKSIADQTIVVYEPITQPSPLVATRHDLQLRADKEVLVVSESIIIANRTAHSYIGTEAEDPVTLGLAVPAEFEKVTFDKEFFGRQFRVNNGRLETGIPWPPGVRELRFTYRLPMNGGKWRFQRPLDLPCELVRVSVGRNEIPMIKCNLPAASETNVDAVAFEAKGTLPAGHPVKVELENMPMTWGVLARWTALGVLVSLVLTAACLAFRKCRVPERVGPEQRHVANRAA
jgi:hypothetical protein